jgi:hypothetical protein
MKQQAINKLWWAGLGLIAVAAILLGIELGRRTLDDNSTTAAPRDTVVVYKSPTCSCCSKWIEHLKHAGFRVEAHNESEMSQVKIRLGVPEVLASCHTAMINGYVIEGHVPAEDIKQLLAKHPKARGLAVPGMPVGSPGMEMGARVDSYDVLLMADDQPTRAFAHHGPGNTP